MSQNTDFIPFARPSLGPEEEAAVLEVLRSGWLTTGGRVQEFEQRFAEFTGVRHALAVNSGTAGLHLALEALGVGPGDEVITSPYTFTASAEIVRYLGADVRFVDIEEGGFGLDPEGVARAMSPRTKAVIPVHVAGASVDMDALEGLVGNVPIVEDAAHAFPSRTSRGMLGTLGTAGMFSFYATKTITTGEGGMVVTNDDALARRMRVMRLHGIDRDIWNRYTSKGASWHYAVVEAGFKYNMTDLAAAIGVEQLKKADAFLERRREIAQRYIAGLGDEDWVELPRQVEGHAWHLFILSLKADLDRDAVVAEIQDAGVGVSVHFIPLHTMPYWSSTYGLQPRDFPRSLARYRRSLSLPIYPGLTEEDADRIIDTVRTIGRRRAHRTR
jgi:dTDP-4-amino-4,6-dideoxygalactose transaminase